MNMNKKKGSRNHQLLSLYTSMTVHDWQLSLLHSSLHGRIVKVFSCGQRNASIILTPDWVTDILFNKSFKVKCRRTEFSIYWINVVSLFAS